MALSAGIDVSVVGGYRRWRHQRGSTRSIANMPRAVMLAKRSTRHPSTQQSACRPGTGGELPCAIVECGDLCYSQIALISPHAPELGSFPGLALHCAGHPGRNPAGCPHPPGRGHYACRLFPLRSGPRRSPGCQQPDTGASSAGNWERAQLQGDGPPGWRFDLRPVHSPPARRFNTRLATFVSSFESAGSTVVRSFVHRGSA